MTVNSSGRPSLGIQLTPRPILSTLGLLLACKQTNTEFLTFLDFISRNPNHPKITYHLDIIFLCKIQLHVNWLSILAPLQRIHNVTVTFRRRGGLTSSMGSMSRFQYGDGSPTPYVYELLRLISKFLVSGPDFDKEENLAKNRRPRINLLSLYCADHYEKRSEEALRNGDAPSKLSYFLDDWIRRLLGYRGFSIFRQFAAGVDYVKLYENGKLLAKWDVKSNMTYMKEFMKQKEIAQWDPGYDSSTFYRAYPDYKPTAWEMEED